MDVPFLVLYAFASLLALRSLVSLMSSHRAHYSAKMGQQQQAAAPSVKSKAALAGKQGA